MSVDKESEKYSLYNIQCNDIWITAFDDAITLFNVVRILTFVVGCCKVYVLNVCCTVKCIIEIKSLFLCCCIAAAFWT